MNSRGPGLRGRYGRGRLGVSSEECRESLGLKRVALLTLTAVLNALVTASFGASTMHYLPPREPKIKCLTNLTQRHHLAGREANSTHQPILFPKRNGEEPPLPRSGMFEEDGVLVRLQAHVAAGDPGQGQRG